MTARMLEQPGRRRSVHLLTLTAQAGNGNLLGGQGRKILLPIALPRTQKVSGWSGERVRGKVVAPARLGQGSAPNDQTIRAALGAVLSAPLPPRSATIFPAKRRSTR